MKKILSYHWWIYAASWLVVFIYCIIPNFAEWPIVPVTILGVFFCLKKDGAIDIYKLTAIALGGLSTQILLWIF